MIMNNLEERFNKHISDPSTKYKHFRAGGFRYIRCDKCHKIVKTDNCIYYGGDNERMFCGGCRNCYGQEVQA